MRRGGVVCTKCTKLHDMQHIQHDSWSWLKNSFSLSGPKQECHKEISPTKRPSMSLQYQTHPFVDSNVSLDIRRCHSFQSAKPLVPCFCLFTFLLLHNLQLLGETKDLLGRKIFVTSVTRYSLHHTKVYSPADKAMSLCYENSLGSPHSDQKDDLSK